MRPCDDFETLCITAVLCIIVQLISKQIVEFFIAVIRYILTPTKPFSMNMTILKGKGREGRNILRSLKKEMKRR